MKIVYAGPMNDYGSCLHRFQGLQELESDLTVFDTQDYFQKRTKLQHLDAASFCHGAEFQELNAKFLDLCERTQPEIVWIDKGVWTWPSTLRQLRSSGAF